MNNFIGFDFVTQIGINNNWSFQFSPNVGHNIPIFEIINTSLSLQSAKMTQNFSRTKVILTCWKTH